MDDDQLRRIACDQRAARGAAAERCRTWRFAAGQWPARRSVVAIAAAILASSLAGCSLFVMAGKMLIGDPQVSSAFRLATGVDLARDQKKLLIVCSGPGLVEPELASLQYDLCELLGRRLKRAGIDLVDSNQIAGWMDDHGGSWNGPAELAQAFQADYVVHVDVRQFTLHEEHTPTMYRGQMAGSVTAWEVVGGEGARQTQQVFQTGFNSSYPQHSPVAPAEISSERIFVRQCVDRLSTQLAQLFYDHSMSARIY